MPNANGLPHLIKEFLFVLDRLGFRAIAAVHNVRIDLHDGTPFTGAEYTSELLSGQAGCGSVYQLDF